MYELPDQHVTIPAEYRFWSEEAFVRRNPATGDLIPFESPGCWNELFAALAAGPSPADLPADWAQGVASTREEL